MFFFRTGTKHGDCGIWSSTIICFLYICFVCSLLAHNTRPKTTSVCGSPVSTSRCSHNFFQLRLETVSTRLHAIVLILYNSQNCIIIFLIELCYAQQVPTRLVLSSYPHVLCSDSANTKPCVCSDNFFLQCFSYLFQINFFFEFLNSRDL